MGVGTSRAVVKGIKKADKLAGMTSGQCTLRMDKKKMIAGAILNKAAYEGWHQTE